MHSDDVSLELELADEDFCVVCLEEEQDDSRDDGMCTTCGQVSDKYNTDPDELLLND